MVRRKDGPSDGGWTFVTSHLVVLLCIAGDPTVRISEVAERTGITVRAVVGILSDLVDEGVRRLAAAIDDVRETSVAKP